jgi:outer membrane protein OmpA-like peptidoglycan-associated protein
MKLFDQEATGRAIFVDSLGITDAFLRAVLEQNFDDAKSLVDPESVSDAKIAGLCIIFEEAKYRLRTQKPLRAMFNRELTAGFIAHVEDETGEKAADFGLNVQRKTIDQPWQVTEVNLDSLLADYADRVAGGDVHYTPLIKNPTGGDTLILYFGFDEDVLTPRTERQLDIVAGLLKTDSDKELTLSGHTDSLGTDQYNDKLSERRAGAVEKYLFRLGVPRKQIVALAEGEAKPRRPNSTADGEDNPSGRRANRRTEIYLDF